MYYEARQEMNDWLEKHDEPEDSLSSNLRKYYEARQEMTDWLEKHDEPEDTKAPMYAPQLQRVKKLKNQVFRPKP